MTPSVAKTAVSASRSGMPAATSAPKTTSRMISVIGIESRPAFERSFPNASSTAASERRADVLDGLDARDSGDDVVDRRPEGGIGRAQRAALDEDALAGGLLEA